MREVHCARDLGIRHMRHICVPIYVSIRQHTPAYVSIRQHAPAYVRIRQHTSVCVSIRQHTSAYVSIRQNTSAYVSIRQHTSAYTTREKGRPRAWAHTRVRYASLSVYSIQVCESQCLRYSGMRVSESTQFRYASLSVYSIQVHIKAAAATHAKRKIYIE
jgi:hypothetical protein